MRPSVGRTMRFAQPARSLRLSRRAPKSKTNKRRKPKIGTNVPSGRSNRRANFQFKKSPPDIKSIMTMTHHISRNRGPGVSPYISVITKYVWKMFKRRKISDDKYTRVSR